MSVASYFLLSYKLFVSNLFIISTYLIIVPLLFFTYGSYIEKQIVKSQIIRIIQELKSSANVIGFQIPNIDITVDKKLDDLVEENNTKLLKLAAITLVIGSVVGYLMVVYLWWIRQSFSFTHMIRKDLLLLLLIVITEILFFTVISKNYRTIDANLVKYIILSDLAQKSKP